jgi:hypothetical protein
MSTSPAHEGKEMSTTVNRCSHLDEHNVSQERSKDITAACQLLSSGVKHCILGVKPSKHSSHLIN